MDESGDEFAWEEVDCQDTTSSSSMEDSDADKKYKKKLHKELFKEPKNEDDSNRNERKVKKVKKSKHKEAPNSSNDLDSFELKTVKTEPDSDMDSVKRKKIKKRDLLQNESRETMEVDNASYLDLLVKEEKSGNKKQKKKKRNKSECSLDEAPFDGSYIHQNHDESLEINVKSEFECSAKKKKKKDKRDSESLKDTKDMILKELFSEEETIVGPPTIQASNKKSKKKKSKTISPPSSPFNSIISSEIDNVEEETDYAATQNGKSTQLSRSEQLLETSHIQRKSPVLSRKENNTRISDRILFEEEDGSQQDTTQMNSGEQSPKSYDLQQYLKTLKNLKTVKCNPLSEYSLTPDDEVWLLKCPSDFNITSLNNVNIPLNSKFKIKMNSHTYEGNMEEEHSRSPILVYAKNKAIVQNVPLLGTMILRKRIPKAHFMADQSINNIQSDFIPLPDTKCRHPLFGPNYKKAIKLDADVQARLSSHCHELTPKEKKKNKKHKLKLECKNEAETRDERRARKRAARAGAESPPAAKQAARAGAESPAAKRARRDPAWDCEQDIQDHLFNY